MSNQLVVIVQFTHLVLEAIRKKIGLNDKLYVICILMSVGDIEVIQRLIQYK